MNVRRPIALIARPNDIIHTEQICWGIKHFCSLEINDDVIHISIKPSDVSPERLSSYIFCYNI